MNRLSKSVSVLIPVYGKAPFLEIAITSIEEQEFQDFEVILILDRPSAEVEILATKLEEESTKIRVLRSENPGISQALNLGIEKSFGEYLARIDADDVMRKDRLGTQYLFLEDYPEVVCVGSQVKKIDERGREIGHSFYPQSPRRISRTLIFRNCVAHPSVMYRKSAVREAGGYRTEYDGAEDYDLWLRMSTFGKITNLSEELTSYRVWSSQFTHQKKQEVFNKSSEVRRNFFRSRDRSTHFSRCAKSKCNYIFALRKNLIECTEYFDKALKSHYEKDRFKTLFYSAIAFLNAPIQLGSLICGYAFSYLIKNYKRN